MANLHCDSDCDWRKDCLRWLSSDWWRRAAYEASKTCRISRERAHLGRRDLNALADAGACSRLTGNRHRAVWEVAGVEAALPVFPQIKVAEGIPMLAAPTEGQNLLADYRALGLTLGRHPLALLRERLRARHLLTAKDLRCTLHPAPSAHWPGSSSRANVLRARAE